MKRLILEYLNVPCPFCGARAGEKCKAPDDLSIPCRSCGARVGERCDPDREGRLGRMIRYPKTCHESRATAYAMAATVAILQGEDGTE